jgi:hypothetical protein
MASQPPRKPGPAKKAKPAPKPVGLMGWLGRQVGHVKKAVKTDVTGPPPKSPGASSGSTGPNASAPQAEEPLVVYRDDKVEEIDHPTKPGMKLRRRVIDEVIVDPNAKSTGSTEERGPPK